MTVTGQAPARPPASGLQPLPHDQPMAGIVLILAAPAAGSRIDAHAPSSAAGLNHHPDVADSAWGHLVATAVDRYRRPA